MGAGGRLERPASVGDAVAGRFAGNLDGAISDAGDAVIGWQRYPRDPVRRREGNEVLAARGTVDGGFDGAISLDRGPRTPAELTSGPKVAVGEDGRAVVVWKGVTGTTEAVVRAAAAPPGAPFGAARDLSTPDPGPSNTPDPSFADVGITESGRAVIAWTEVALGAKDESGSSGSVIRTESTAGGEWTPPVAIWSTDGGRPASLVVATGPGDRAAIAWERFGSDTEILVAPG